MESGLECGVARRMRSRVETGMECAEWRLELGGMAWSGVETADYKVESGECSGQRG